MVNRYVKKYLNSLAIREINNKSMSYSCILPRLAKKKSSQIIPSVDKDVGTAVCSQKCILHNSKISLYLDS